MNQNPEQEEPYIRYWARDIEGSKDSRFFFLTLSGGEGHHLSPENAGARLKNYYLSNPEIKLINGSAGEDNLNRPLNNLENERFLKALGAL